MSRESFYFSHDYNARHDPKIKKLILKHTMTGYGIFWAIVEDLYNNANALPLDYDCIAFDLHTECEVVKSIINDFDLFVIKDGFFGSSSVERRLDERNNKSESARQSAFCRWGKKKTDANAMRTQCDSNAIKERKGKERKRKEFIKPTLEEVEKYFFENGYKPEIGKRAWMGYDAANWFDSKGDPILSWKQKMVNVWFRDEHKITKSEMVY